MVSTQGGASGYGSGTGVEPIDERLLDFITSEITHCIIEAAPVTFGTINERIMELLNRRLSALREEITSGQLGARTPSF